ncbi:MAG: helix-turn-helix domain-containing protein [Dehalococcoidia bacterium]
MERNEWKRLASYIRQRRIELGYRVRREFAAKVGLTDRTLGTLESGQHVGLDTLAAIEIGLRWAPGSAEHILAGGEPESTDQPIPGTPAGDERSREVLRRRAELVARIEALKATIAEYDAELAGEVETRNTRRTV